MSDSFLYKRITKKQPECTGTLAEPDGAPEPRFAYLSTVSWMHSLALLVDGNEFTFPELLRKYDSVNRYSAISEPAINTTFEQLLMSLHHLSALRSLEKVDSPLDVSRIGIMSWYYGIYCAASAMLAACEGAQQGDHTGTANAWDRQISVRKNALYPFDLRLTTSVEKDAKSELAVLKNSETFTLPNYPATKNEAHGAYISYLSGTRDYKQWLLCETLKKKELKQLNLSNFKTKAARELRDARLRGKAIGFLQLAVRYRGKANYRDALFLAHSKQENIYTTQFNQDLSEVLSAFLSMAGAYCSKRLGTSLWQQFIDDLEEHSCTSVKPNDIWS